MAERKIMKQQAAKPKVATFALTNRKKKQLRFNFAEREMEESFKPPKAEMEEIIRCRSPKKGRRSSLLKVGAKVERLEEEVAAKRAETTVLKQQLMEEETKVEACLEKLSNRRMLNALLFLGNLCDQHLVDDLARCMLG